MRRILTSDSNASRNVTMRLLRITTTRSTSMKLRSVTIPRTDIPGFSVQVGTSNIEGPKHSKLRINFLVTP